jgi:hypothetical protein
MIPFAGERLLAMGREGTGGRNPPLPFSSSLSSCVPSSIPSRGRGLDGSRDGGSQSDWNRLQQARIDLSRRAPMRPWEEAPGSVRRSAPHCCPPTLRHRRKVALQWAQLLLLHLAHAGVVVRYAGRNRGGLAEVSMSDTVGSFNFCRSFFWFLKFPFTSLQLEIKYVLGVLLK